MQIYSFAPVSKKLLVPLPAHIHEIRNFPLPSFILNHLFVTTHSSASSFAPCPLTTPSYLYPTARKSVIRSIPILLSPSKSTKSKLPLFSGSLIPTVCQCWSSSYLSTTQPPQSLGESGELHSHLKTRPRR